MPYKEHVRKLLALATTRSAEHSLRMYRDLRLSMDVSIAAYRQQLGQLSDEKSLRSTRTALAHMLLKYYSLFNGVDLLEEAVLLYRCVLEAPDHLSTPAMQANLLDGLGIALTCMFEQHTRLRDVEEAILLHEQSLQLRADLGTDVKPSIHGLGRAYTAQAIRGLDYSDRAVELLRRATSDTSNSEAFDDTQSACYLTLALYEQGKVTGDKAPALSSASRALEIASNNHGNYILALICAARALKDFHGNEETISQCRDIYELGNSIGHPYYALAGMTFSLHTLRLCSPFDVTTSLDAVNTLRDIHQHHVVDHCFSRIIATSLTWGLMRIHEITGRLEYLDEEIAVEMQLYRVYQLTGNLYRPLLHNLATALRTRYNLAGNMDDLDQAISCDQVCVSAISGSMTAGNIVYLNGLGAHLLARYVHTGDRTDLQRALDLQRQCLQYIAGISSQSLYESWLEETCVAVSVYRYTSKEIAGEDEIKQAIEILKRILTVVTSELHHTKGLNALSDCLRILGYLTSDASYAKEAIDFQQRALSLLPQASVFRGEYQIGLGEGYLCIWRLSGEPRYLQLAIKSFSGTATDTLFPVQVRLQAALTWCEIADISDPSRISEGYDNAVSLLPQTVIFGGDIHTKLKALRRAPWLSSDAAMHALKTSSPMGALDVLERARAVWWMYALTSRQRYKGLPLQVQDELINVSRALEKSAFGDNIKLAHRMELMCRFNIVVKEIQTIPDYEHFLGSPSISQLQSLARFGPVVVLICTAVSAAAIILPNSSAMITSIALEGVNGELLEGWTLSLDDDNVKYRNTTVHTAYRKLVVLGKASPASSFHTVLASLWDLVACPIVSVLGFKPQSPVNRPRMFLCATGPFASLPVHAAGRKENGIMKGLSDYVVTSYTPTLTALLNGYRNPPTRPIGTAHARALLVAIPDAPMHAPLPNTSTEIALVRSIVPQAISLAGDVSVDKLLNELPSAAFLHLACHGKTDAKDPLSSGFVFQDGMLKISRLMDVNVPDACFAFLSSCESARGDNKLPDENIHLSAAMLFVGYRSVIGTQWSMHDTDGPRVAERVYTELMKNKECFDYDAVPRALAAAVRELRDTGVHPSRWATWIHMGI